MDSDTFNKSKMTSETQSSSQSNLEIVADKIISEGKTTLMIKNIPNKYTKNMLLNEIR